MSTPTHNPNSEFRRISFLEGRTKERFYQLGQFILSEDAYIYSIDDTSYVAAPDLDPTFIRSVSIQLITKDGVVKSWYSIVEGINVCTQKNGEEYVEL